MGVKVRARVRCTTCEGVCACESVYWCVCEKERE